MPVRRKPRLSDRDIEILKLSHEQKYLTLPQIAKTFFPESRNKYKVPLRCVNRLMRRGLLRSLKQRIGMETLYPVSRKGMRVLEERNLLNGLPYVKTVDWKTSPHDLAVTDMRLIFEKLGFEWTAQRIFKKARRRGHVPDGKATYKDQVFWVEMEMGTREHDSYEWIFRKRLHGHADGIHLYIVRDETVKAKRLKEARGFKRIYFVSIEELRIREGAAEFMNSGYEDIVLLDTVDPEHRHRPDRSLELFRTGPRRVGKWGGG